tara:strand:+ start:1137 stop:1289 length:153 start_codon:yes stop_codon:yes gene_type:complete
MFDTLQMALCPPGISLADAIEHYSDSNNGEAIQQTHGEVLVGDRFENRLP